MKQFYSTQEVARLMGISRVAVFQKIKKGEIPAVKRGRNFGIAKEDIEHLLSAELSKKQKKDIEAAVTRVVDEYGDVLRLLGQE